MKDKSKQPEGFAIFRIEQRRLSEGRFGFGQMSEQHVASTKAIQNLDTTSIFTGGGEPFLVRTRLVAGLFKCLCLGAEFFS
jgi:hypothetical protein